MANSRGSNKSVDQADEALHVGRNDTSRSYGMQSYISTVSYGGYEKNGCNTYTTKSAQNTKPPDTTSESVKDETEDIKSGCCCGKNFDVFSDQTSFHGLKHINGDNNWSRRIAWIIILTFAFAGLTYQINRSVSTFFDFPTNININYVTKSAITFPKVTVCNINMFKFDKVTPLMGGHLQFYINGLRYLQSMTSDVGITSDGNGHSEITDEMYPGNMNLKDFIEYNGHQIEDMLKVCTFNGLACGPDNFTMTFTNYGACYFFNPTSKIALKNAGQRHGLTMILNVEHLQYITAPRENVGFRIAIDGHDDTPDLDASGVDVAIGTRTSIGLRKQTITSLPAPHGSCIMDGEKQLKYQVNEQYTQSRCFLECETDYFMGECGCRMYYTPGDINQIFCSPANLTGCYIPKYEEFADHRIEYCQCQDACDIENFIKTTSFSSFPSRGVPQTFYATNQYEYILLAFGFNVRQYMDLTRHSLSWQLADDLHRFVNETCTELNITHCTEQLPEEHADKLHWEYLYLSYEVLAYLVNKISDNIFYDVAYAMPLIGVDSDFYNETLDEARNVLRRQIGSVLTTLTEVFYSQTRFTEEQAVSFSDVLLKKIFVSVYPQVREACYNFGESIFSTSDLGYLTHEYMVDNLAKLDIYYESLNVEEVREQRAYELFSIVCDLGGALGLFFGASLVAFVEAIDFWFIKGCCGPKKKRK